MVVTVKVLIGLPVGRPAAVLESPAGGEEPALVLFVALPHPASTSAATPTRAIASRAARLDLARADGGPSQPRSSTGCSDIHMTPFLVWITCPPTGVVGHPIHTSGLARRSEATRRHV